TYTLFDTAGLRSVKVYADGKLLGDEITGFDDINNYTGSFTLEESSSPRHIRLVAEDKAGNVTDTDSENFRSAYVFNKDVIVTTNFFVRLWADQLLFWITAAAVISAPAAGAAVIVLRKKVRR
ncbi:MAG: hypothetical protein HUJ75_07340, partial [Parasporobacterium sp.]|nr:hypothetical protein [Parasporobacterium sp.]